MAQKRKKRKSGKTFRFQLTLGGIIGIGVVFFCLFMWMFLLGIWAGQTILLPSAPPDISMNSGSSTAKKKSPVHILGPEGKKKLARQVDPQALAD
ncbi:MAG: hypothetical protein SCH71_13005 [Desulfobulbaceae bacterium]|nr:hypothetical protein [Desulfobulbaceae bacterium]